MAPSRRGIRAARSSRSVSWSPPLPISHLRAHGGHRGLCQVAFRWPIGLGNLSDETFQLFEARTGALKEPHERGFQFGVSQVIGQSARCVESRALQPRAHKRLVVPRCSGTPRDGIGGHPVYCRIGKRIWRTESVLRAVGFPRRLHEPDECGIEGGLAKTDLLHCDPPRLENGAPRGDAEPGSRAVDVDLGGVSWYRSILQIDLVSTDSHYPAK